MIPLWNIPKQVPAADPRPQGSELIFHDPLPTPEPEQEPARSGVPVTSLYGSPESKPKRFKGTQTPGSRPRPRTCGGLARYSAAKHRAPVAVGLENHFGGKDDGGRRLRASVRQFTDSPASSPPFARPPAMPSSTLCSPHMYRPLETYVAMIVAAPAANAEKPS